MTTPHLGRRSDNCISLDSKYLICGCSRSAILWHCIWDFTSWINCCNPNDPGTDPTQGFLSLRWFDKTPRFAVPIVRLLLLVLHGSTVLYQDKDLCSTRNWNSLILMTWFTTIVIEIGLPSSYSFMFFDSYLTFNLKS